MSTRRLQKEFYDSAFGLPDFQVPAPAGPRPPPLPRPRSRVESSSELAVDAEDRLVGVEIEAAEARAPILAALGSGKLAVAAPEALPEAALVIADARADVQAQLAALRSRCRPDAAVLLYVGDSSPTTISRALEAGAFACLRAPVCPEEVLSMATAALDTKAARVQVADLTRKLDLQAHLASIGRMSAGLSHEISSPLSAAIMSMTWVQGAVDGLLEVLEAVGQASPAQMPALAARARAEVARFRGREGGAAAAADVAAAHERLRVVLEAMRDLRGNTRSVRREHVDLLALAHEVRKWVAQELQGVETEVIGEPVRALADATLVGQILQNLVSNGAHAAHTLSSPRIRIHAYARGDRAVVSVRDNGPGIAPELHDRIFEPFFTTRRGQGGTGLGLALCREYALQMGAELSLWSMPGRGACFRLDMPGAR